MYYVRLQYLIFELNIKSANNIEYNDTTILKNCYHTIKNFLNNTK